MPRELSQNPVTVKDRTRRQTSFHTYFRSAVYERIKGRCRNDKDYKGLPFMDKKEWFRFLDSTFIERAVLFNNWQRSGRQRGLAPSIDRIDSKEGYIPDNVRWLTQAENSLYQIPWTRLKTLCKNGHPLKDKDYRGIRCCLPCRKESKRRYYLEVAKPKFNNWGS